MDMKYPPIDLDLNTSRNKNAMPLIVINFEIKPFRQQSAGQTQTAKYFQRSVLV